MSISFDILLLNQALMGKLSLYHVDLSLSLLRQSGDVVFVILVIQHCMIYPASIDPLPIMPYQYLKENMNQQHNESGIILESVAMYLLNDLIGLEGF